MFLYVILLTHGLEHGTRRVSAVRTAKPTHKDKGTVFNSSLLRILNQSINYSIHIIMIPLHLIGFLSILDYTNIACIDTLLHERKILDIYRSSGSNWISQLILVIRAWHTLLTRTVSRDQLQY
jgi:hypothetical protein